MCHLHANEGVYLVYDLLYCEYSTYLHTGSLCLVWPIPSAALKTDLGGVTAWATTIVLLLLVLLLSAIAQMCA